jgi:hypothetical protein
MVSETIDAGEKVNGRFSGASRGLLVGLTESCEPLVDFPGNPDPSALSAHSTVALSKEDVGKEAVLVFEDCDPCRPILVGLLQNVSRSEKKADITVDGERVTLSAEREMVLRCGDASITLTRAGKVLIRGKYVVSRSSGVNMVKGAIVHVN